MNTGPGIYLAAMTYGVQDAITPLILGVITYFWSGVVVIYKGISKTIFPASYNVQNKVCSRFYPLKNTSAWQK